MVIVVSPGMRHFADWINEDLVLVRRVIDDNVPPLEEEESEDKKEDARREMRKKSRKSRI
jgi:hypothetical protein